ncbi:MAG: hypothetical protein E6736_13470 [Leclercia adecarboxylata]|nr:hypothetical protein [Leclercia adecarboxylata]
MTELNKQALRIIAAAAKSAPSWYAVGEFGDVVDPAKEEWKPVHEFCKTFTAEEVLALLDELEEAEYQRENVIRVNCGLFENLTAAEKRIIELEASHTKLRDSMAAIHNTIRLDGAQTSLAVILNAAKRAHEESAAVAAGISIKGG